MRRLEEIKREIKALQDEALDINLKAAQDAFLQSFKQVAQKVEGGDLNSAAEITARQLLKKAGDVLRFIESER